jgi:hypothetical protein
MAGIAGGWGLAPLHPNHTFVSKLYRYFGRIIVDETTAACDT